LVRVRRKVNPHQPGRAPALGLRAGSDSLATEPQTSRAERFFRRERTQTMLSRTFSCWLHRGCGAVRHRHGHQSPSARRRFFLPRLAVLEDRTLPSVLTVMSPADSGDGSLRAVIAEAGDGDQIVFDPTLQGQTITLTSGELAVSKSLDIEGLGADQLAVSGNHQSRVFDISGGATVTIAGLTITDGLAYGGLGTGGGGGLYNNGSHVTVANDTFANNEVLGLSDSGNGNAQAGALDSVSDATLTVRHCLFLDNEALATTEANAGAIHTGNNTSGEVGCTALVIDSTFIGNRSVGGSDGTHGFSRGGALYNGNGSLTVEDSTFIDNQALGGSNNAGGSLTGQAMGGAIANTDQATLLVTGSIFRGNQALGGSRNTSTGGSGNIGTASAGALANADVATVTDSLFEDNEARGGSGNTGDGTSFQLVGTAVGGGISMSAGNNSGTPVSLTLHHVTLRHNQAVGGDGNTAGTLAGTAQGGGLATSDANSSRLPGGSTTTVSDSTITDNEAVGGRGADGESGADALGGGLANLFGATLTVSASTVTGNQAFGGDGGAGGNGGSAQGGGLFNDGPSTSPTNLGAPTTLTVLGSSVIDNQAQGGTAGVGSSSAGLGAGGGIASADLLTLLGSSLAYNRALGGAGEAGASCGDGLGGGLNIAGGIASVLDTAIDDNQAAGGDAEAAATGGNGFGGGVYVGAGTVLVNASEITSNAAVGGHGGADGLGVGGGVYNVGTFIVDPGTVIAHNHASDGNDDCFGC
jgi:hypothetical protein